MGAEGNHVNASGDILSPGAGVMSRANSSDQATRVPSAVSQGGGMHVPEHFTQQAQRTGSQESATRTASHASNQGPMYVDIHMAQIARRTNSKVKTTQSYVSRLQPGMSDVSKGTSGVILALHQSADGYTADVLWDHGKPFSGYCVGYRGLFDLEVVPDCKSDPDSSVTYQKIDVQDNIPRLPSDVRPKHQSTERIDIDGGTGVLTVNVGYLGKAPQVNHDGAKHIWSNAGPMSYK